MFKIQCTILLNQNLIEKQILVVGTEQGKVYKG